MRIYLDNAATSWPKPEAVYAAIDRAQREWGVAAGRGVSREASEIARMLQTTRAAISGIINGGAAERIAFCQNGTAACNTALLGMLQPGDHVITTQTEHNSILRPLEYLKQSHDVAVTIIPCDARGWCDPAEFAAAWQPRTKMIALNHASNVTGILQDAVAIGTICRERGGFFLLDAAQSLGHIPIDVAAWKVDLLAAPGHKGLLGPLGTGLLTLASVPSRSCNRSCAAAQAPRAKKPSSPGRCRTAWNRAIKIRRRSLACWRVCKRCSSTASPRGNSTMDR